MDIFGYSCESAATMVLRDFKLRWKNSNIFLLSLLSLILLYTELRATDITRLSPFVVGHEDAAFSTIQAAVAAAAATQKPENIWVRPGTYSENIDFSAVNNITLWGAAALGDEGQVEIIGHHIPPTTGTLVFRNFRLSDDKNIFFSEAAGTAHLVIIDAFLNVTNGFTFNLPNWRGIIELFDTNKGRQNDGGIYNLGGASVFVYNASIGVGTANTMVLSGPVSVLGAGIACAVSLVRNANFTFDSCVLSGPIICRDACMGSFNACRISSGASSALTMASTSSVQLNKTILESTNESVIRGPGPGPLGLNDVTFVPALSMDRSVSPSFRSNTLFGVVTIGSGLHVSENNEAVMGKATLVEGTATISSKLITHNSRIFLSRSSFNSSDALGFLVVGELKVGSGFVIKSVRPENPSVVQQKDASTFNWIIIEPASL